MIMWCGLTACDIIIINNSVMVKTLRRTIRKWNYEVTLSDLNKVASSFPGYVWDNSLTNDNSDRHDKVIVYAHRYNGEWADASLIEIARLYNPQS